MKSLQDQVERLSSTQNVRARSYSDAVKMRNAYPKPIRRELTRFQSRELTCYNCKSAGHFSMNCPYPRRCYKCGKMGHIGRFCRMAPKPRQVVNFLEENATGLEGSVSQN